jgi:hypothetical protein
MSIAHGAGRQGETGCFTNLSPKDRVLSLGAQAKAQFRVKKGDSPNGRAERPLEQHRAGQHADIPARHDCRRMAREQRVRRRRVNVRGGPALRCHEKRQPILNARICGFDFRVRKNGSLTQAVRVTVVGCIGGRINRFLATAIARETDGCRAHTNLARRLAQTEVRASQEHDRQEVSDCCSWHWSCRTMAG